MSRRFEGKSAYRKVANAVENGIYLGGFPTGEVTIVALEGLGLCCTEKSIIA
jgi:hypothetical protein